MSTSSIQDTDDDTLGIVGNFNSTNGISSGGGSNFTTPSNFFTNLVNNASSGIASLFNSSPNPTSTSTSTSTPSDSSSPSSNFFTDLTNSVAKLFSSSSSLPSGVAGPGAELVNSGETVTIGDNQIIVGGKKDIPEKGFIDQIGEWVRNNPAAAVVLGGLAAASTGIFSSGSGGNTTNPPGDTSNQPGDTNNQSGDTNNQSTAEEKSLAEALGISAPTLATLLKYGLPALASYLSYQSAKDAQEQARGVSFSASGPTTATRTTYGGSRYSAAQGGVASLAGGGEISQPFYLGGSTDGMADEVPAHIDNQRPAALSDGEFVVPADVVSHLGNGNSNAGAKRLYEMMDRIREARTGSSKQGIQVNPNNFMPG